MSSPVHSSFSQALQSGVKLREYKIKRLLSVEADSFVYLAVDTERDRLVTIKEHFPALICERDTETGEVYCSSQENVDSFDKSLKAFENQTMTLARLRHHGVPEQHHLFPENGTLYRVAHYVEGYSLTTLLNRQDDEEYEWFFEEEQLRSFLWRLIDILDYIHGEKVLHLDIKPRYIVFTRLGNPLLTHFCSNRELHDEWKGPGNDTAWFAPEEWGGSQPHGPWTDLYSVGAVFYKILTGEDPERSDRRLAEDTLPKLADNEKLSGKYTKNFLSSIDKALSLEVKDRFEAAMDWQDYLLKQRGYSRAEWLGGVPKSRKWISAACFGTGFLLFCAVLWGAYMWFMGMMDFKEPPPVTEQATELEIKSNDAVDGEIWGMAFTLKDYGFGVNYETIPAVAELNKISFISSKPPQSKGTPPLFLSIRDKEGKPLALSRNSVRFLGQGKVEFDFGENVILSTTQPYQYVFITGEGGVFMADVRQTRLNPLTHKGSRAFVYGADGKPRNDSMPLMEIKLEPNSGATPLTETLKEADVAQSPGYASPRNWCLHPGVVAKQSSIIDKAEATFALDGQMSGDTGSLTDPAQGNGWWMVTLGAGLERPVRKIIVYNMPEKGSLDSRRLSNYRIEIYDRLGQEVAHKDFYTEPGTWLKDTSESWTLPETVMAHTVRIRKLGKGAHPEDAALFLAEVEVVAPAEPETELPRNLADWCQWSGVRAEQSKTWRNWISTYGAHRAIGKQTDPRYYAHTEEDNNPGWWEVDLGEARPVEYVRLTNCQEKGLEALRLSNFRIILKDDAGKEIGKKEFCTIPGDYASLHTLWKVDDLIPQKVRSIRIEKLGKGTHPYDNALTLMKVEVFGPNQPGTE